jgi:hypothetical protein
MTEIDLARSEWLVLTLPDGRTVRLQNAREGPCSGSVRLGIEAPRDIEVWRGQVHEQRRRERLDRGRAGLPPIRLRGGIE